MGKFSLEHKIKDRLKGHEVHIDKRELWKGLGIEEEEKDRKVIWLWWFAGLLGLAFTTGLWWYVQNDGVETSTIQEFSMVDEVSSMEIDESLAKTGNESIKEVSPSEKLSSIINEVKSGQLQDAEKQIVQNGIRKNSRIHKKSSSKGLGNESNREDTVKGSEADLDKVRNESGAKGSDVAEIRKRNMSLNDLLSIDQLPLVSSLLTHNKDIKILDAAVSPIINPIKEVRKFEVELYGGLGSINRELSTTNREINGYIAGRDSSESTLEHVSFGASLKYFIGGGFYGKAGIEINRWNEKYTYNIISDTTKTPVTIPDIILIDLQGNSSTQFIEGTQISYNEINWVRYNRLTQIDLPISFGCEQRINRWSLFGEVNAIINMKQMFTGYLNTVSGQIEKDPDYFKPSIGLNLGFNAGVGYGITPRIRARVSARYYRSLDTVLDSDFGEEFEVDQRYTSFGVRLGVGYLF